MKNLQKQIFKDYRIFFFLVNFIFFLLLSILKIYNFKSSFYDFGFYLNYYKELNINNFDVILNHNFQLINFFIVKILGFFEINKWIFILILIQSLSLALPHLILKSDKNLHLIYFLFPTLWFTGLNNFHPDVIIIPIIFIINNQLSRKEPNFYLLFLYFTLIVFIKLSFILIVIGYLFFLIYKKKDNLKFSLFFLLFLTIYFIVFLSLNNFDKINGYQNLLHLIFENLIINSLNLNYFITILVLLISSGFIFNPNYKKIIPIIPILIVYFLLPFGHLKNFYNHYYIPIFPFFILALQDSKFLNNFNKKTYSFFFLIHILLSSSPFSIVFWTDYNWFYDKQSVFGLSKNIKTNQFLNDLDLSNKVIYVENNVLPFQIFQANNIIKVIDNNSDFNDADYIFLRSNEPYFIGDNGCGTKKRKRCSDNNIYKDYNKIVDNIKNNYSLFYTDNMNFSIYKK